MTKFSNTLNYLFEMGPAWTAFRVKYELLKKSGHFDKKNQEIVNKTNDFDYSKISLPDFKIIDANYISDIENTDMADRAIRGCIRTFSHEDLSYLNDSKIDWSFNPVLKKSAPNDMAWNKIPDFSTFGDIKLIWELSRFPQIYSFINAYSKTKDRKYADACINQILNWCDENSYPNGVNYKCGQEISFRLFSWFIALDYFSSYIEVNDYKKILKIIYASLLRVEVNIDFAAKSVKNNHSISEATGLLLGGLLFPELPDSKRFINTGHKYLRGELKYQVYADGSYIQHSFIYQRLVLDTLSFAINIAQKKDFKLDPSIKIDQKKMITFLYSFVQKNGNVPNYGSNDGTNIFPSSSADYLDFRESLNFASLVCYGKNLFKGHDQKLKLFGLHSNELFKIETKDTFADGGYYVLSNERVFLMVRCHSYRDRPCQSDMLHLDLWVDGINILCDSGSYSYNGDPKISKNIKSVKAHNTIAVNDQSQMLVVGKFGWGNWVKSKTIKKTDNEFTGQHFGYQKLGFIHERNIKLSEDEIIITDKLIGSNGKINYEQNWISQEKINHLNQNTGIFQIGNIAISSDGCGEICQTEISNYYNNFTQGSNLKFSQNTSKSFEIKTKISLTTKR